MSNIIPTDGSSNWLYFCTKCADGHSSQIACTEIIGKKITESNDGLLDYKQIPSKEVSITQDLLKAWNVSATDIHVYQFDANGFRIDGKEIDVFLDLFYNKYSTSDCRFILRSMLEISINFHRLDVDRRVITDIERYVKNGIKYLEEIDKRKLPKVFACFSSIMSEVA